MTATEPRTGVVTLHVNGGDVEVAADHPHLLSALRDDLGLTAAKDGCSPSGQCGCCTVLVDGKPMVACQQSLEKVAGRAIVTLEGIDEAERARYAEAFASTGALQCGFCTPGLVMSATALLAEVPHPTADDVRQRLVGNVCRCTGYTKIVEAILDAAGRAGG
jgi:aerobic-type carbon monoxide dehydrogenase small subunit (CoxS/CutS family)